jgi:hypothetical protein
VQAWIGGMDIWERELSGVTICFAVGVVVVVVIGEGSVGWGECGVIGNASMISGGREGRVVNFVCVTFRRFGGGSLTLEGLRN